MFTGIIESIGTIKNIVSEQGNIHFTIASPISNELKIDQSVSHNGTCLTVVGVADGAHTVTAVEETLSRTNLSKWQIGSLVNLERCLPLGGRLDGHLVQGHVDAVGKCEEIADRNGSWFCTFRYQPKPEHLLVDKGSISLNGISLTVVNPVDDLFSVAIIPYTWENTNFKTLKVGDEVNLEFDIVGKYIASHFMQYFNEKNLENLKNVLSGINTK